MGLNVAAFDLLKSGQVVSATAPSRAGVCPSLTPFGEQTPNRTGTRTQTTSGPAGPRAAWLFNPDLDLRARLGGSLFGTAPCRCWTRRAARADWTQRRFIQLEPEYLLEAVRTSMGFRLFVWTGRFCQCRSVDVGGDEEFGLTGPTDVLSARTRAVSPPVAARFERLSPLVRTGRTFQCRSPPPSSSDLSTRRR